MTHPTDSRSCEVSLDCSWDEIVSLRDQIRAFERHLNTTSVLGTFEGANAKKHCEASSQTEKGKHHVTTSQ